MDNENEGIWIIMVNVPGIVICDKKYLPDIKCYQCVDKWCDIIISWFTMVSTVLHEANDI